jgi:hypothetical protein
MKLSKATKSALKHAFGFLGIMFGMVILAQLLGYSLAEIFILFLK